MNVPLSTETKSRGADPHQLPLTTFMGPGGALNDRVFTCHEMGTEVDIGGLRQEPDVLGSGVFLSMIVSKSRSRHCKAQEFGFNARIFSALNEGVQGETRNL